MDTATGVSVGAGAAILAFLVAKFELIEKVYGFIKKLFGEKSGVNINDSVVIGDAAGRDINKNKYDMSRRRGGDMFNTVLAEPQSPVFKRNIRLRFAISDPAVQASVRKIWDDRDDLEDWFTDYVNAVLTSDEFLETVEAQQELQGKDGWELQSIDGFDNNYRDNNHGLDCMLSFTKPVPKHTDRAQRPSVKSANA